MQKDVSCISPLTLVWVLLERPGQEFSALSPQPQKLSTLGLHILNFRMAHSQVLRSQSDWSCVG